MEGKITFFAYNMGAHSVLVNGPGISLRNFLTFLRKEIPKLSVSVFLNFPTEDKIEGVSIYSISKKQALKDEVKSSDLVHCWSGLKYKFINAIKVANDLSKPVILGPNLLDCEYQNSEKEFLQSIQFDYLLSANPDLKTRLADTYNISKGIISDFMVGPDLDIWKLELSPDNYILWKGNADQAVKDIDFAKKVAKKLPQFNFLFLGEGQKYGYFDHISVASKAAVYINTSAHETKGLAQLEQMAAGVPSVTHNKIYCCGIDGETGYVTDRDVESYAFAVNKIMSDDSSRQAMRYASRQYVEDNFSSSKIVQKYMEIIKGVC